MTGAAGLLFLVLFFGWFMFFRGSVTDYSKADIQLVDKNRADVAVGLAGSTNGTNSTSSADGSLATSSSTAANGSTQAGSSSDNTSDDTSGEGSLGSQNQNTFSDLTQNISTDIPSLDALAGGILPQQLLPIDDAAYNAKMIELANVMAPAKKKTSSSTSAASTAVATASTGNSLWPVKGPYPNTGALLPYDRIVAYYGNFYSGALGVLGAYPPQQMITKLMAEVDKWKAADPNTPVVPAIDYIATTAQGSPGADGKYRLRMPADQIELAISLANQIHGVVFLDVQDGWSSVQSEVSALAPYLKLPNVELALDPEFSMPSGVKPGKQIGSMSAADINWASEYLQNIVQQNHLPPKVLVVHRFTYGMITDYKDIKLSSDVQMLIDMDGWGTQPQKVKIYKDVVESEPVQFTGIKLFYKNDLRGASTGMLTPSQILKLSPRPSYIQFQ